ncbi:MAG: hypothetical protein LW817_07250 [Candidatus Caenarcaniphilales bacterium]|jgi:hypothetical protein|nr:hypothetical protein [Candidatus Caenarcaniphilales bacterium]
MNHAYNLYNDYGEPQKDNVSVPQINTYQQIKNFSSNSEHEGLYQDYSLEQRAKFDNLWEKQLIQMSYSFWYLLILFLLLPVCKSGLVNFFGLGQNIKQNIQLNQIKSNLNKDKIEFQNKLNEYHSSAGLKRTLKEEIKVLEQNEILIKIAK